MAIDLKALYGDTPQTAAYEQSLSNSATVNVGGRTYDNPNYVAPQPTPAPKPVAAPVVTQPRATPAVQAPAQTPTPATPAAPVAQDLTLAGFNAYKKAYGFTPDPSSSLSPYNQWKAAQGGQTPVAPATTTPATTAPVATVTDADRTANYYANRYAGYKAQQEQAQSAPAPTADSIVTNNRYNTLYEAYQSGGTGSTNTPQTPQYDTRNTCLLYTSDAADE